MRKKIVELKIEETKAIVGGVKVATAATVAMSASALATVAPPIATLV